MYIACVENIRQRRKPDLYHYYRYPSTNENGARATRETDVFQAAENEKEKTAVADNHPKAFCM